MSSRLREIELRAQTNWVVHGVGSMPQMYFSRWRKFKEKIFPACRDRRYLLELIRTSRRSALRYYDH